MRFSNERYDSDFTGPDYHKATLSPSERAKTTFQQSSRESLHERDAAKIQNLHIGRKERRLTQRVQIPTSHSLDEGLSNHCTARRRRQERSRSAKTLTQPLKKSLRRFA